MNDISPESSVIDIIIPIYNGSKYLKDLINNLSWIFEREFFNLVNVILVNDGSIDNTPKILEKFAEFKYKNLKIISQNNQGEGPARNTGMKNSNSPYILFLDCDDKLLKSGIITFLKEYKKFSELDIYVGSYFINRRNKKLKICKNFNRILKGNIIPTYFFNRKIYYGIGNTIISRKIQEKNNIWFKNFETGSDNNFFRNLSIYAKKLVSTSNEFFIYQKNQNSVMERSETKFCDVINSLIDTRKLINIDKSFDKRIKQKLNKSLNYFLLQEVLGLQWRSIINKNEILRNESLKFIDDFPLKINLFDFLSKVKPTRRVILLIFNYFPEIILFILNFKGQKND